MSKFLLNYSRDGQFYWQLLVANGETICMSEMYTTKAMALNGIASCKENSKSLNNFVIFQSDKNLQYYWNLKAMNGHIIAQSEGYIAKQSANNGVMSCYNNAPYAAVVDLTLLSA